MKIYAISDPHISGDGTKPMDVFGGKWVGYLPKIAEDWQKKVDSGDVVVVAGDISWAMDLPEAVKDINGFFAPLKAFLSSGSVPIIGFENSPRSSPIHVVVAVLQAMTTSSQPASKR